MWLYQPAQFGGVQNMKPLHARYDYFSEESKRRWQIKRPTRLIDHSLGRPILVTDDDGVYLTPPEQEEYYSAIDAPYLKSLLATCKEVNGGGDNSGSSSNDDDEVDSHQQKLILSLLHSGWTSKIYNSANETISGTGVFSKIFVPKGRYLGPYMGTVMTEEEWEERADRNDEGVDEKEGKDHQKDDDEDNFVFVLKDGAHEVVLDASSGTNLNELKYINHSCVPNTIMHEMFLGNCWNVLIFSIKDIQPNEELTHDYKLSTEDPNDGKLNIKCCCGKKEQCRGTLFTLHEW